MDFDKLDHFTANFLRWRFEKLADCESQLLAVKPICDFYSGDERGLQFDKELGYLEHTWAKPKTGPNSVRFRSPDFGPGRFWVSGHQEFDAGGPGDVGSQIG